MPSNVAPQAPRADAASADAEGLLEEFFDHCDAARSVAAARRLIVAKAREAGIDHIVITTHFAPGEMGSLGVFIHNWREAAAAHLHAWSPELNPLFDQAERANAAVYWNGAAFRTDLDARQAAWMDQLTAFGFRDGVTQRIRTILPAASVSLASRDSVGDPVLVRRLVRMASYVFNHVLILQRPAPTETDVLTVREQQCLYLAALEGKRPREVAKELGVSVNTVRSTRQSASQRLGARSPEEMVWRMVETGQLFQRGRIGRPRSW